MDAIRQQKIADQIRDIIAQEIRGPKVYNDALLGVVIIAVNVTNDLSLATIYFRMMQPDLDIKEMQRLFKKLAPFLRSRISQNIRLKKTPHLRFEYDHSVDRGSTVEKIIDDLKKET